MYALSNKIWQRNSGHKQGLNAPEKKIAFDFSRIKTSPFDIKSETSYDVNLSNASLELGLKKTNCIAWADIPDQEYQDHIIEAKIRLDSLGGYSAAGVIFHIMDDTSYYLALLSNKGYFRIDVVKDNAPRSLIAWTEIQDFDKKNINLKIITYGTYLIFLLNNKWIGEASDNSVSFGRVGVVLASYPTDNEQPEINNEEETENEKYTCKAYLDFISIDTRIKEIEENFKTWTDDSNINAEVRLRLAETYAVMGDSVKALDQINRAWKKRDDVIISEAASHVEVRTRRELLLAARMSFSLRQYAEAEKFIDSIIDQWADSAEGKFAYTEKIKILNELDKFAELKEFVIRHPFKITKDIDYYTIIARCNWELKEYKDSAEAWDKALDLTESKTSDQAGVYTVNAGNAYEFAGNKKEALKRFITAGNIFLNQGNNAELAALMPKFSDIGSKNWEAHTLAGKWAFSIEDYDKSAEEFAIANKLRGALKSRPKADPAAYYLWALVLNMKGRIKDAIRLLEKAVDIAPDYGLFRFKLAEIKLKNGIVDPAIAEEFKLALNNIDDEQKKDLAGYAGNLFHSIGDTQNAKYFFEITQEEG